LFFNERSLWQGSSDRILNMGDVIDLRVCRVAKNTLTLQLSLNGKDVGCDESIILEPSEDIFFAISLGSVDNRNQLLLFKLS